MTRGRDHRLKRAGDLQRLKDFVVVVVLCCLFLKPLEGTSLGDSDFRLVK